MRNATMLGHAEALEILRHVLNTASADGGKPVAICVVDTFGRQLAALVMDGTKEPSIAIAHAKAVTAVRFERDTVEFHHIRDGLDSDNWVLADWPTDGEPPMGWSVTDVLNVGKTNTPFTTLAGGVLVRSLHDDSILGAVGVSNRKELEDHELASQRPSGWSA